MSVLSPSPVTQTERDVGGQRVGLFSHRDRLAGLARCSRIEHESVWSVATPRTRARRPRRTAAGRCPAEPSTSVAARGSIASSDLPSSSPTGIGTGAEAAGRRASPRLGLAGPRVEAPDRGRVALGDPERVGRGGERPIPWGNAPAGHQATVEGVADQLSAPGFPPWCRPRASRAQARAAQGAPPGRNVLPTLPVRASSASPRARRRPPPRRRRPGRRCSMRRPRRADAACVRAASPCRCGRGAPGRGSMTQGSPAASTMPFGRCPTLRMTVGAQRRGGLRARRVAVERHHGDDRRRRGDERRREQRQRRRGRRRRPAATSPLP